MLVREIKIDGRKIGKDLPVFLIAEAGVNHNGKIEIAKKLIDISIEAQVDAIKFQTYIAEDLVAQKTPKVKYQKISDDEEESFYEMVKKYELTKEEFKELRDYCSKKKIIFLSTPFGPKSVEWLEELDVSAYKISSGDMNNFPLLRVICMKNKPILLSTGMASQEEVIKSVNFIKSEGLNEIAVFQCTTNYPTPFEDLNLNIINTYRNLFPDLIIGFSDHSLGIEASVAAVAKGVKIIEKHFTLDKNMDGPDHKASLNPDELKRWVLAIRNTEKALGESYKKPGKIELEIRQIARKSVVSTVDLKIGDEITNNNITIKRPGYGIPPTEYFTLLKEKKKVKKDIPKDTVIKWEDLD